MLLITKKKQLYFLLLKTIRKILCRYLLTQVLRLKPPIIIDKHHYIMPLQKRIRRLCNFCWIKEPKLILLMLTIIHHYI
uniref:Putative secreted protein n=1 Tax=Xenopsylla cheopis TaxID=163159 RepID=A0A6M2E3K2_XENCH